MPTPLEDTLPQLRVGFGAFNILLISFSCACMHVLLSIRPFLFLSFFFFLSLWAFTPFFRVGPVADSWLHLVSLVCLPWSEKK